eukprot:TRINITY_DN11720_c0_g1::TRINITY_DN11720_c0_g1_i1::g.17544::m.17544 TRINITY_DN11720_c0_g1::TRINITY_DN11720_c0_g1_i1::g.17544  ORF type:complete len:566 (+),score=143.65,sp/Q41364/DIT1_SPIOL/66.88/0.0,Na_sulph_symp/PF00939.14/1.7e-152,Gate/PF07670.9/3.5e+03,Gate/PF07670.9/0.013,Gate/PF07670.9/3e+02 TRINITY_DN11720_c0_g1_i1:56-1699(+)
MASAFIPAPVTLASSRMAASSRSKSQRQTRSLQTAFPAASRSLQTVNACETICAPTLQQPVAPPASPTKPAEPKVSYEGAKKFPLFVTLLTGLVFWNIPVPEGVTTQVWHLFAIFIATIVGIITQPLPLGAVALVGLGTAIMTKTLTFQAAFSAFANEIPWLIALAFFFSRGFIKTGLGNRIAYFIVANFGKTTLGLCYSLVFGEALLAPAIPSISARAGGIFVPLIKSLCSACGSKVGDGTERKMGAFLTAACFQAGLITSAMFLTAQAANPLIVNLAAGAHGHTITWMEWAIAAFVPGMISLLLVPYVIYLVYPPGVKVSEGAPRIAASRLELMGPMSKYEIIMALTLLLTFVLWVVGPIIGIGGVAAAITGLAILMITGVVTWKECLAEGVAWDTLTWFAALIAMADYLNKFGLIDWFSKYIVQGVQSLGFEWPMAFAVLSLLYFYSHFLFASAAAHIGAMYAAFLMVAIKLGAPPVLASLVLGFFSSLFGGLTHYGFGSAPVFYGTGYVSLPAWWAVGLVTSIVNVVVWLGVGSVWWKIIGLW